MYCDINNLKFKISYFYFLQEGIRNKFPFWNHQIDRESRKWAAIGWPQSTCRYTCWLPMI